MAKKFIVTAAAKNSVDARTTDDDIVAALPVDLSWNSNRTSGLVDFNEVVSSPAKDVDTRNVCFVLFVDNATVDFD